jgi:flagellar hook-basal body complex protein FliE
MTIDKMNPAAAASAYANIQKTVQSPGISAGDTGGGFGDVLKNAITSGIETLHQGEKASAAAVAGKADLTDVVQAVNGAEFTLETFVAVRDRMLSAYDKIMQMPM